MRRKIQEATRFAIICAAAIAAHPGAMAYGDEYAQLEQRLIEAGVAAADLKEYETLVRQRSPSQLKASLQWLSSAPPNVAQDLIRDERFEAREQARQLIPAAVFPDAVPQRSCESLRELAFANTTIEAAVVDPNDQACHVTSSVRHPPASDRVRVYIALPVNGWNGRFQGTGGGGFYGGGPENLRNPVAKGYAAGATDTGHEGGSGSFALDANGRLNWQEIRDNGYLGIHAMSVLGKAITLAFYGKAPRYTYFVGDSMGGRQGLMEAQRFPDDYDGILSGCPAIHFDRIVPALFWPQDVMLQSKHPLPQSKQDAATAAAVKACDGADGVMEGVIDDPSQCTYDPKALVGSQVGDSVFTDADAEVIRKIWEGPQSQDGHFLWYGVARGANLFWLASTGGSPLQGKPFFDMPLEWFKYFLVHDRQWDWTSLKPGEFELLFNQSVEQYGAVYGTDNPDLTRFRDHGGKLIIYHGLADQLVPAQGSIDYYQQVQKKPMGGAERTTEFARLFLIPGVDHDFAGTGPSPTGMMDAIVAWVEKGKAPERLLTESLRKKGKPTRTRPLFPYPAVARYTGKGSTDKADNFVSSTPTH